MQVSDEVKLFRTTILSGKYDPLLYKFAFGAVRRLPSLRGQEEELVCDARTELYMAADRFDPEKGCAFITYAGVVIRNHFLKMIRTEGKYRNHEYSNSSLEDVVEERSDPSEFLEEWSKVSEDSKDVLYKLLHNVPEEGTKPCKGAASLLEVYLKYGKGMLFSDVVKLYLEKAKLDMETSEEQCCGQCKFYAGRREPETFGICERFPTALAKLTSEKCGEFRPEGPSREVLETPLNMIPNLNARTRSILANMGLSTIEDLLLVGPGMIRSDASPQRVEVKCVYHIRMALRKLGVTW